MPPTRPFIVVLVLVPLAAAAQTTVSVDPTMDVRPISPLIYGANFATAEQINQGGLKLLTWGGDNVSLYNYQLDVTNFGSDYFFENRAGCWTPDGGYCVPTPTDPKTNSQANKLLDLAADSGVTAQLAVPTLGWVADAVAYSQPFPCSYPKTQVMSDTYDPYDANCGTGQHSGAWDTAVPLLTSKTITSQWDSDWATYVVGRYGASSGGRIYTLDNEPALWSSTHHDVHPMASTYDEVWQKLRDGAVAVLTADPTANVSGPAEWGWLNYFCSAADSPATTSCTASSPDRAAHGGEELTAWLLDQAKAYEQTNGVRILHYLDLHYFPAGGQPPDITRSLWDPSYTDPSYINDTIRLIPRMHDWVDMHYPGTRLMVSQYDFSHHDDAVGAVTYAEVLGIFGREGLDAASAWALPETTEMAFAAYRLYGNYDALGGHFESTSVRATVTGSATVKAYAAVGATRATVVLVNEGSAPATIDVTLGAFAPSGAAQLWVRGTGSAVVRDSDVPLTGGQFEVTLAAAGIGMLVVDGGLPVPDAGSGGGAGGGGGAGTGGGSAGAGGGSASTGGGSASTGGGSAGAGGGSASTGGGSASGGGSATVDAGSGGGGSAPSGCGCTSGGELSVLAIAALLALRRAARRSSLEPTGSLEIV